MTTTRFEIVALLAAVVASIGLCAVGVRMVDQYNRLEQRYTQDETRWQIIEDKCSTNELGAIACPPGTVSQPTTTTTEVAK